MQPEFLEIYNEELRFLRESGTRFANAHPQVARHLGMHGDEVQDPFVERMLEGAAFLTARIQQRLDTEQAGFALQLLARLAPGWMTPVPAIATLVVEPDFTSPQWMSGASIPRGTQVALNDTSLQGGSAVLTTCRDIRLFPLDIEQAACTVLPPQETSEKVARSLQHAEACIWLRLSTRGVLTIDTLGLECLSLTFAGDDVRANALLSALLAETRGIVVWSDDPNHDPLVLSPSAVRMDGLDEEQALLPVNIGELPGMRLLREFFAAPSRYYGVELSGLGTWLASCRGALGFHIAFALTTRPDSLLDRLGSADFRLFASPAINLHRQRCSPLNVDATRTEQHVVVDRLRPERHEIHHLTKMVGIDRQGREIIFRPMHGHAAYGLGSHAPLYQARRVRNRAGEAIYGRDSLHDEVFVALTAVPGDVDDIATLLIEAMVCQRDLHPARLEDPRLSLDIAVPVRTVNLLRMPTRARPAPDDRKAWHALGMTNSCVLRHALPDVEDCSAMVRDWLETFADLHQANDRRRIASITAATIDHRFVRHPGPGPLAWTRGAHLCLDIDSGFHADGGAFLFGEVIRHAMKEYCDINQTLSATVRIDGEAVVTRELDHAD